MLTRSNVQKDNYLKKKLLVLICEYAYGNGNYISCIIL